jgi:hypothetical protein
MTEKELEEIEQGIKGETGCDIDLSVAREEAIWYSIMNVLAMNLGSGMGIPVAKEEVNSTLQKMGISPSDLPRKNPMPLQAVFKSGDPHLMQPFDQQDFGTWRWNPATFDRKLVPQAQGWSIIASTECAKWFEIPVFAESIPKELRDEWKVNGVLLCMVAQKQCEFAFEKLRNKEGLFVCETEPESLKTTDETTNLEDQACMLWACSDLARLASDKNSMYASMLDKSRLLDLADHLFEVMADRKDSLLNASLNKVLAQSVAIPALVWYASATEAQDLKARCLWLLREFADNLVKAQDQNEMVGDTLIDAAAALRALIEAWRVTKLRTYAESATKLFNLLESHWYKQTGVYPQVPLSPEYTYNADDIGIIVGALNASRLFLTSRIDQELAELRMRVFFCKAVNVSGLQMSMPSPSFMPAWLQEREPSIHFRYGSIPLPSEVEGGFGVAPVFAGEVAYDPQSDTWSRRVIFDAPAAMHACCELVWLNHETINGFPKIILEGAPLAVREAAGASGL